VLALCKNAPETGVNVPQGNCPSSNGDPPWFPFGMSVFSKHAKTTKRILIMTVPKPCQYPFYRTAYQTSLKDLWRRLNSIKLHAVKTQREVLLDVVDLVFQALELARSDGYDLQATRYARLQIGYTQITHSRKRQLQLVAFLVSEHDFHSIPPALV
jgi:hypothetical protein